MKTKTRQLKLSGIIIDRFAAGVARRAPLRCLLFQFRQGILFCTISATASELLLKLADALAKLAAAAAEGSDNKHDDDGGNVVDATNFGQKTRRVH